MRAEIIREPISNALHIARTRHETFCQKAITEAWRSVLQPLMWQSCLECQKQFRGGI